jgi:hypothetical protein
MVSWSFGLGQTSTKCIQYGKWSFGLGQTTTKSIQYGKLEFWSWTHSV